LIGLGAIAVYVSLFVAAFVAATILPAPPSEAVLAGLIAAGRGDIVLLLTVATVGNTLGSAVNWILGRGIEVLEHKGWLPIPAERYEQGSRIFRRYGEWTLLLAWMPIFGDAITVVAGAARVHLVLFLVLVGLGKAARYVAIIAGLNWVIP
jgi:membrane protein YqaA with SNARE-associated domain